MTMRLLSLAAAIVFAAAPLQADEPVQPGDLFAATVATPIAAALLPPGLVQSTPQEVDLTDDDVTAGALRKAAVPLTGSGKVNQIGFRAYTTQEAAAKALDEFTVLTEGSKLLGTTTHAFPGDGKLAQCESYIHQSRQLIGTRCGYVDHILPLLISAAALDDYDSKMTKEQMAEVGRARAIALLEAARTHAYTVYDALKKAQP